MAYRFIAVAGAGCIWLLPDIRSLVDWPMEFSRFEIAFILVDIRQSISDEPIVSDIRPAGGFATKTFSGILGNGCG